MQFRRAARFVRRVSGIRLFKRIVLTNLSIPDVTATDYDNEVEIPLLEAVEAQDEEAESDGAGTVADTPLYSRLESINLNFMVTMQGTSPIAVRWLLYKEPDGESLLTDMAAQFHNSEDGPTARELRKNTIAKGMIMTNASAGKSGLHIRVRGRTLRRLGALHENDRITLVIAKEAAGTSGAIHGYGTIVTRANG